MEKGAAEQKMKTTTETQRTQRIAELKRGGEHKILGSCMLRGETGSQSPTLSGFVRAFHLKAYMSQILFLLVFSVFSVPLW